MLKNNSIGLQESDQKLRLRLQLLVFLGVRLRLHLHPKTSGSLRLRLRNPDIYHILKPDQFKCFIYTDLL